MWRTMLITAAAGLLQAGTVCAGTPEQTPEAAFHALEQRLLEAPLRVGFDITASGAFSADLNGVLQLGPDGAVQLSAAGSFGGEPVQLALETREGLLLGGNGEPDFRVPQPAQLREALVIGLTRMGLLHNLARLVAGKPPDHADGGVRGWVQVRDVTHRLPLAADVPPHDIYGFGIVVSGQPAGEAELHVDPPSGLPFLRRQTVRFESGEMQVREEYQYLP